MTSSFAGVVAIIVAASACGDSFDDADARDVFTSSYDTIHALHTEAAALPAWPATYELACPEGGGIAMTTGGLGADGKPTALRHAFTSCGVNGWVLDGQFDYNDITFCDPVSPSFAIVGQLAVSGRRDTACAIDAHETCGAVGGTSCGVAL